MVFMGEKRGLGWGGGEVLRENFLEPADLHAVQLHAKMQTKGTIGEK